jgi:hypothetical protein
VKFFTKNYLFCFFAIFTILAHQLIFQNFFPNNNSLLGHDYSLLLPNLIFGKIWFNNNFLSIPWFSPSFCCGTPFFSDPQTMYYSFQQLLFIFFSPLVALKLSFLFFSLVAFFGMFFLMHKTFKMNIYIALIAATLFLFNGFFNYRAIIGHFSFLGYVFIPIYCHILIQSFENNKFRQKSFFYLLVSSILFANFIHSGSGSLIVVITLSIIFVISIYTYLNKELKIIYNLILSFIIGLAISSSKINASFAFLNNFTREYPSLLFENFFEFLSNSFKSLFFYPDITKFNSETINNVTNQLQIHEIEFGVSVIPLIIFIIFIFNLKKIKLNNFTFSKLISLLTMFVIIVFTASINVSNNEVGELFRKMPVIKSTWIHYRLTSIYILPIIIISCIILNKINFKENNIKIFTFFCLILIFFQNYSYKKDFYNNQNYDPKNIEKFYSDKNKIKNTSVKEILIFLDKNKKPVITNQRNDMFIYNFSPLFCYNPIFGYNLEKLPTKKFTFNSMVKINDNLFSYKGNPKIVNKNGINFFNPSCFVFPNENNCIPGDLFKKNQSNELEKFLNYKNFTFNLSKSQKIFNYLSLIILFLSIIYILYYLIREKVLNKLNEKNY